jgi:hypothetical protein
MLIIVFFVPTVKEWNVFDNCCQGCECAVFCSTPATEFNEVEI